MDRASEIDTVHVAIGKNVKSNQSLILFALKKLQATQICIIYVHKLKKLNIFGAKLKVKKLAEQNEDLMRRVTNEYGDILDNDLALVDSKFIASETVERGIVELINTHQIRFLVLGAGAEEKHKGELKQLASSKAQYVNSHASHFCEVVFVFKGEVVSFKNRESEGNIRYEPCPSHHGRRITHPFPQIRDEIELQSDADDLLEDYPPSPPFDFPTWDSVVELKLKLAKEKDKFSIETHKLNSQKELLEQQLAEAEEKIKLLEQKLSEQAREVEAELSKREKADHNLSEAYEYINKLLQRVAEADEGMKLLEEKFVKQLKLLDATSRKADNLGIKLNAEKELSVQRLAEADAKMNQLEQKLLSSMELIFEYRSELQAGCEKTIPVSGLAYEFKESEIFEATNNFDASLIIGRGAYGTTYCSFLRQIQVAIKVRNPNNVRGVSEFHQELAILGRVRHPNVVTLIGTCPSNESLVYEFLPYGSLEDRLRNCKDKTSPLTWAARLRIAADLCSVLLYLHSSKDHCIVHGDLKPSNVLLGANFVPKMSDFGVLRLIRCRNVREMAKIPWEGDAYPHVDPEFGCSGDLNAESDVYSFGVLLLRLLTNRQPLGLPREVMNGRKANELMNMVDCSAGEWPFVVADQIAEMAVRCCAPKREERADLETDVWSVLKGMRAFYADAESCPAGNETPPAHFVCPISQDVMEDPHVAADGFTYEAEAVKKWFERGHNTSPMTNLKLPNCNLVPNRSLRSAIQEWVQRL